MTIVVITSSNLKVAAKVDGRRGRVAGKCVVFVPVTERVAGGGGGVRGGGKGLGGDQYLQMRMMRTAWVRRR